MGDRNGTEQPAVLGFLCQMIIEELKNLSSTRHGLSESSLHDALSYRSGILDLLGVQGCLNELKGAYSKVLAELGHHAGEEFRDRFCGILSRIHEAPNFNSFRVLRDDIIDLVQDYSSMVAEDKRAFSGLIVEIGAQLCDVENKCLGLIQDTTMTHRANNMFNTMMDSHVNDMEEMADSSKNLSDIRRIVKTKLETIKRALERKKTEDRLRERRFESDIERLTNNLKEMQERVARDQRRRRVLELEVLIDPLTGIANRRGLDRHLRKEIKKFKRHNTTFSLVFFDIDDFKKVNDTYGHWVGDKCISYVVERVKQNLRESDFIARFGGDEFVVCLPMTDLKSADFVATKLSNAISNTRFIYQDAQIQLAISAGAAQVEQTDATPESIIARADAALYEAKSRGRETE